MATGLRSTLSIVAALAFGLTACGSDETESSTSDEQSTASADTIMISGNLTYLERIALEPGGTATVTLEDISKADSSATLIAEQVIGLGDQQVPIPFELTTDAAELDDRFSYSVRATITGPDGKLQWTTDTVNLIDPSETTIVLGDLVMVRVEGA